MRYTSNANPEEMNSRDLSLWERILALVALKNKYDPTNLFRMNQNIKPTV